MDPFAEMRQATEEKWRADTLEQLHKIRKLLEVLVGRGSLPVNSIEATSEPWPVDCPAWVSPYECDSTAGNTTRPGLKADIVTNPGGKEI